MAIAGRCTITNNSVQVAYVGRDKWIDALRRVAKNQGMTVVSCSMGPQVTPVGLVKLRMMTIFHDGDYNKLDAIMPEVEAVDVADVFRGM